MRTLKFDFPTEKKCFEIERIDEEKNRKCAVCNEEGDGIHFGAEACRACTAFFRRSVALNKSYKCRVGGNCDVSSNIRCLCRSCRFEKCLRVGMHPKFVQNRQEPSPKHPTHLEIQPITPSRSSEFSTPSSFSFSFSGLPESPTSRFLLGSPNFQNSLPGLSSAPSLETMPLLERMRINYEKMENARNVIHRHEGENIFQQKIPRALNFREAVEMTRKEIPLVADFIECCFEEFGELGEGQKTILFQNFYISFCKLQGAFKTAKCESPNRYMVPSGDYIDYGDLKTFFSDCGENLILEKDQIQLHSDIFMKSFDLQNRSLINLMRLENIDNYEFFAICVMLFWDFGLEGQSDECNEIGRRVKHRITREMTFYLRNVKKHEEPLYRMASVVAIIPFVQKIVHRFQYDIEMSNIFSTNVFPQDFCNIVSGKIR